MRTTASTWPRASDCVAPQFPFCFFSWSKVLLAKHAVLNAHMRCPWAHRRPPPPKGAPRIDARLATFLAPNTSRSY